jgi:hypothetical protein
VQHTHSTAHNTTLVQFLYISFNSSKLLLPTHLPFFEQFSDFVREKRAIFVAAMPFCVAAAYFF